MNRKLTEPVLDRLMKAEEGLDGEKNADQQLAEASANPEGCICETEP